VASIGSLVVNLTLQSSQFINDLNKASGQVQRSAGQMQRSLAGVGTGLQTLGRATAAFFAVRFVIQGAKDLADYADAWKIANNQVAAGVAISGVAARSMSQINEIAIQTRTGLEETAEVYGKLIRSAATLGITEAQVARTTLLLNEAIKAGGASTQEATNAIRQFAQSVASGIFQGDELRSLRENAPLVAAAIAKAFDTTVGGLKKLGAEGKLTADKVIPAILKDQTIEKAFAATNATIADSFTNLNNAVIEYIGTLDKATGASKAFTEFAKQMTAEIKNAAAAGESSTGSVILSQLNAIKDTLPHVGLEFVKFAFWPWGDKVVELLKDYNSGVRDAAKATSPWIVILDALRRQLQLAAGDVQTFAVAMSSRVGVGGPRPTIAPGTLAGHPPPMEVFHPDPKQVEFMQQQRLELKQQQALNMAAREGQKAFDALTDSYEAQSAAIAKGLPVGSAEYNQMVQTITAARQLARENSNVVATVTATQDAQRQAGFQKLLTLAGQIGGSDEVRKLQEHIDLLNEASSQNIDLATDVGQAWLAAREGQEAATKSTQLLTDQLDATKGAINSFVSSGIGAISSAFAEAVVEGGNFKEMLDSLLKDLAKMALDTTLQLFLKMILGQVGTSTTAGTGLLGGMAFHSGGMVGSEGSSRSIPAGLIAGAPRFHSGLMGGEFPAILKRGEGVFTPGQMKALGQLGKTENNFTVINQMPNSSVSQDKQTNASGGSDITVFIRQTMTKEITDPASVVHRSMKASFGLSEASVRR